MLDSNPDNSKADHRAVRRWRPVAGEDGLALGRRVQRHGDDGPDMEPELLLHREAREGIKRTNRHPPTNQLDDVARSRRRKADDCQVAPGQKLPVHDTIIKFWPMVVAEATKSRVDDYQSHDSNRYTTTTLDKAEIELRS